MNHQNEIEVVETVGRISCLLGKLKLISEGIVVSPDETRESGKTLLRSIHNLAALFPLHSWQRN